MSVIYVPWFSDWEYALPELSTAWPMMYLQRTPEVGHVRSTLLGEGVFYSRRILDGLRLKPFELERAS